MAQAGITIPCIALSQTEDLDCALESTQFNKLFIYLLNFTGWDPTHMSTLATNAEIQALFAAQGWVCGKGTLTMIRKVAS